MMRRESDSNQIPFLQWLLRLLQLVGAYRKKKNIVSYFTMVSLIFVVILQGLDLILNWTGIDTFKRVIFMPGIFVSVIKGFIMIVYSNEFIEVIAMLKYFWRADAFDLETKKKIDNGFHFVTKISVSFFGSCYLISTIIALVPLMDVDKRKLISSEFPLCDLHGNLWCWLAMYLWETYLLLGQTVPIAMSFDSIFIIFVGYIYNGCDLLKAGLKRLNIEDVQERQLLLQQTVEQQNVLMNFVKCVDEMFTGFMLIQFCTSLLSLIVLLYMMVASESTKIAEIAYYVLLYLIFAFQLLIYALGGAIIQDKMNSIPYAIYEVDWHSKGRTNLRKDLTFMILRAQNVRVLSVGKLTDLNLALYVATIRNSFSVFTLIWQLFGNGTDNQHVEM